LGLERYADVIKVGQEIGGVEIEGRGCYLLELRRTIWPEVVVLLRHFCKRERAAPGMRQLTRK
jgi:hypothetical protein